MKKYGHVVLLLAVWFSGSDTLAGSRGADSVLSPDLRAIAKQRSTETVPVSVMVSGEVDLGNLVEGSSTQSVGGLRWIRGKVAAKNLEKLASIQGVSAVLDSGSRKPPVSPDPDLPKNYTPLTANVARLKALKSAPAYSPDGLKVGKPVKSKVDKGWFLKDTLGLEQAWDAGFKGEGVKVAVIDTGIDFAHPDLYGKQARIEDASSPYYGWPVCFDGHSMASFYESKSFDGTWYVGTDSTPAVQIHGATATATLSISTDGLPQAYTFTFKAESVSGVYRFGLHPDTSLWDALGGAPAVVLLVDNADTATRGPGYNTVYVDLDGDQDFTDEKPCFRGDEVSFRDTWNSEANAAGPDGYPDISGGMIYFIADGLKPIPASDWLYGMNIPTAGSMVAFMLNDSNGSGETHGTLCASAVAAGGVINGYAPSFKPAYSGAGSGMVVGPAPEAGIIAVGNYYEGGYISDFQLFCALGYDGIEETGDEPNVVSMSYGSGATDNDGWDWNSRFVESVHQLYAPRTTWCNSSGNGGPGYATVSSPAPAGGISVGACTSYDTCGVFDSITSTSQILGGDVQGWSCSGPQADGRQGVSVMAHGAWASGDLPLNLVGDGWGAWESWGGTSRACPEAAGVVALIYQAYKSIHGVWPSGDVARQILMNSAQDLQYDIFRQGAGRVHAGRAVELATGMAGVAASPESWIPGDFRGETYSAYTHLVQPGDEHQQQFTISNSDSSTVSLQASVVTFESFKQMEFSINTSNSLAEQYSFSKPDYLHLFQGPGVDSIPADTAFMMIEAIFPFEVFDTNFTAGDAESVSPPNENAFRLLIYDWTDQDGDGMLFDDSIGTAPGVVEASEIDAGEYMRFNYGYNLATSLKVYVSNPLEKMHDGIFIGIQHRTGAPLATAIQIRATFYREKACPWLQLGQSTLSIPAGATQTLNASVTIPEDMPYGAYSAKIILTDPSRATPTTGMGGRSDRTVIPVSINVAASLESSPLQIPGTVSGTEPYENYAVHGDFGWDGDGEEGDGRLFFIDVPSPAEGDYMVTHTRWEDALPTDMDTLIFGPAADTFTNPLSSFYSPEFGPNTLGWMGGYRSPGRPNWTFETTTGTTDDYSTASVTDGLHALFVHNILFSGNRFAVPFSVEAGKLNISPAPLHIYTVTSAMVSAVTLTSSLQMDDLRISAFGPSKVEKWYEDHVIRQGWNYWYTFYVNDCGLLQVDLDGTASDIDLYLYRDGADGSTPDGKFTGDEVVDSSLTSTSVEQVSLLVPPDGFYCALAYGYSVVSDTDTFNMTSRVISGHNVTFAGETEGPISPGVPRSVTMECELIPNQGDSELGDYEILLCMGPEGATQAITIQVPVTYYVPGDANEDGLVTIDDFFGFPLFWLSGDAVPVGIDYNHDGAIRPGDLLDFLEE